MTQKQLKELIREEYHNVKSFMEDKYGFVPELGQVVDNPYVSAFKVEDYLETSVNEGDESDSDMAVDQLETSIKRAQELIAKLRGKGDLEPWVQSLITKAEDYISTVSDYGDTKNEATAEEEDEFHTQLDKLVHKTFGKSSDEEIDEYDVENEQDIREFIQFIKEYKKDINEAEYQGRDVKLNKIMQGDVKKFKVYVKNPKGNVVKVNFGHGGSSAKGKTMKIKKSNPERRKSFRARHNCDNPGPRHKARYWACRTW